MEMENDWKHFVSTGNVMDYLSYKAREDQPADGKGAKGEGFCNSDGHGIESRACG